MSLTHVSPKRPGRVYVRKFDHDEAQRRYESGETIAALATEYGVTVNAVWQIVTETGRASSAKGLEDERRSTVGRGVCDGCGGPMNLKSRTALGSTHCTTCVALAKGTSAREGELRCMTCHEWKPDEEFCLDRKRNKIARRGRNRQCRSCLTAARQDYRERHKVPCVGCGAPALPPSEKRTRGASEPRCRACMYEHHRTPEFRQAARERALAARNGGAELPDSGEGRL